MNRMSERGLLALLLLATTAYAIAEELTLVTYYPSPRGVYNELRVGGGNVSTPAGKLNVVQEDTSGTAPPAFRVDDQTPQDDTPFVIDREGNVGIGTAAPAAKLHVRDTLQLGNEGGALGNSNGVLNSPQSIYVNIDSDNTGTVEVFQVGANGAGTSGSDALVTVLEGGNVGIGTASPEYALDVNGSIRTASSSGIVFSNGTNQVAAAPFSNVWVTTSTATFTVPAGVTRLWVEVFGGGGGGAGGPGDGGGGAGGEAMGFVNVTPDQDIIATVGAGGSGGAGSYYVNPPGDGTAGGSSSFGGIVCSGGGGANAYSAPNSNGGGGGTCQGGDINRPGGPGDAGPGYDRDGAGGKGGSNTMGVGGSSLAYNVGATGSPFGGGGGSGGSHNAKSYPNSGGSGGPGGVIVWW